MDFFKSILSEDPDPDPPPPSEPAPAQPHSDPEPDSGGAWSFGGLLKTITTRSESVLETYRRDLQEFGSGLKKETDLFRDVAARAVKDLPASVDDVIKSTSDIISHGKDTLLAASPSQPLDGPHRVLNPGRYSRFESQLVSIQGDPNTFCVEPEDVGEFERWRLGFDLGEKSDEVEDLIVNNKSLEGIYNRVVPGEVDHETFWCRYFYRVYRLMQQESVRAKLVKRAISVDEDDEELSWDVDDDDVVEQEKTDVKRNVEEKVEEGSVVQKPVNVVKESASDVKDGSDVAEQVSSDKDIPNSIDVVKEATISDESRPASSVVGDRNEENQSNADGAGKSHDVEPIGKVDDSKKQDVEVTSLVKKDDVEVQVSKGKSEKDESSKDADVGQKTGAGEDDLDWADIEDIEGDDHKKPTSHAASSNKADLRKRLSVEEDDEDLSWDIEDDDEPVKA